MLPNDNPYDLHHRTDGPPLAEPSGCAEVLNELYAASAKLRLRINDYGQKVKLFSEWDEHATAMKHAEAVLHNAAGEPPAPTPAMRRGSPSPQRLGYPVIILEVQ